MGAKGRQRAVGACPYVARARCARRPRRSRGRRWRRRERRWPPCRAIGSRASLRRPTAARRAQTRWQSRSPPSRGCSAHRGESRKGEDNIGTWTGDVRISACGTHSGPKSATHPWQVQVQIARYLQRLQRRHVTHPDELGRARAPCRLLRGGACNGHAEAQPRDDNVPVPRE